MAISKGLIVSFLIISLLAMHLAEADLEKENKSYGKMNCASACKARCQLASRQKLCHRACGTCCARCNCVPPGTSGNTEVCPCYANMTTHGGRKKCP